jgi:hypothetical protein
LLTDRTFLAIVAAAAAVLAIGLLRTDTKFAGAPKWFWMEKLCWGANADVVIAGDSRVYRGIDPSALHGSTGFVRNFGFSNATLTREYLWRAASLLSSRGRRILVLGISPYSLRYRAAGRNGYQEAQNDLARLRLPVRLARALEEWEVLLQPIALDAGAGQAGRVRALSSDYVQAFHENGWVESDRLLADAVTNGLAIARQATSQGTTSTGEVGVFVDCVRELRQGGLHVVAFRPPVPPEVAQLEDSLGFLDYESLVEQLTAVGAAWIEVDGTGLRSYDGSHLDGASAAELSRRLAIGIEQALQQHDRIAPPR